MSLFSKRISKEEYENIVSENNRLKFEVERLERTVQNLKNELDKVAPRIQVLTDRINTQQRYIDKYNIEVTSDEEKWCKHQEIDKPKKGKRKESEKDV